MRRVRTGLAGRDGLGASLPRAPVACTNGPHMSALPLVTIGVPTYNRSALLRACLERLRRQTYGNFRVIVSDNASTDDTEAVCREFAREDARIRYHRQPRNLGPTRNFEFLREQASGKYFLWVADDDLLAEDYIARCVACLEGERELVLASGVAEYRAEGEPSHAGNTFNCLQPGYAARIVHYYRNVQDNAIFYGVYRTTALARCSLAGINLLGNDWLWIAQILYFGKARMLEEAHLVRKLGGASASYASILRVLGLPQWLGIFPRATLVAGMGWGIAFRARALIENVGLAPRLLLAARITAGLSYRFLRHHVATLLHPLVYRLRTRRRKAEK
jgi:glycosyltransferase involved in cell wall biosynthesis